jgi:YVTN family beta-propeller protein
VFALPFYCGEANLIGHGQDIMGDPTWIYEHYDEYTFLQTGFENDCYYYFNGVPGVPDASTRFAILGQLPQTLTLSSQAPLHTMYGMPLLYVYDKTATVVATETAISVSSNGTQATFPFPTTLAQNGYSLALVNQTGGSLGFSPAGTNLLSIASSQTIAGNPFGVSVGAQTDNYTICVPHGNKLPPVCHNVSAYETFPIVSLYSLNQVLVNGTPVTVGLNPTAVVAYTAGSASKTVGGIAHTYSGNTRALVANSGSNTVSILDIVNNAMLFTVTVGSQPVALAVAPDGSAAYVANYQDSTITRVDLNALTTTSTVAVGGKPTSVALASSGALWVGGVGFLTEINTQTMSVVGTEPVANKNIVALGYSNSLNELIATSVDINGNVIADEVNPSTFQAGANYTPVASHMISTLGTYTSQPSGQPVRAFTSTLSNNNSISTNQVGAPPLVVQDGWAVVTATPTGFTITDASGHLVLVSETTPSPVTAIAVDAKLSIAYLTMPDSNTLLTVPLPGTN